MNERVDIFKKRCGAVQSCDGSGQNGPAPVAPSGAVQIWDGYDSGSEKNVAAAPAPASGKMCRLRIPVFK